jgi:1-acyl-sn-glycerol-3-phosphate acyltransferase
MYHSGDPGRWRRRLVSLCGLSAVALFGAVASPALWLVAFAHDRLRGGTAVPALRVLATWVAAEVAGLAAALWIWLTVRDKAAFEDANYRLQARWAGALLASLARAYGLQIAVEGALGDGPALVFVRHASMADTLLPVALCTGPAGLRPRYVLKRELLADPCLDVVGQRLANAFVNRGGDPEREGERVGALATDLGPRDVVVIFPEGTRFSARGRQERIARFRAAGETRLAEWSESLTATLLPRAAGPLALLDAAPGVDVVFFAHRGFEGLRGLRALFDASLRGRSIAVQIRRIAAAEIPREREARLAWLYDEWRSVDAFVGADV